MAIAEPEASVENVKAPLLLLVGEVRVKELSNIYFTGTVNVPKVGTEGETTNVVVTLPEV